VFTEMSRRDFFKKAGVLSAALALSGCGGDRAEERLVPFLRSPEEELAGVFTQYASLCRQCPAGCGILVSTMGGRAHKLEGNPRHPLNQGKLCARGQAGLQALYNPDRLVGPQARTGSTESFQSITWDDGLKRLTEALSAAASGPGSGAVLIYGGQLPDHTYGVAARLLAGLDGAGSDAGSAETDARPLVWNLHRALDGAGTLDAVAREIYGSTAAGLPFFDLASAEVVISFSADLFGTWLSPVYFGRAYGEMRRGRGVTRGYLAQVEPRLSATGVSADEWLAVPAGREAHVALCLGRVILDEGLAADSRPAGVDAVFQGVDARGLAAELGLSFERLVRLARVFGGSRAPLAIPGGGLGAAQNGADAMRTVMALNLLAGAHESTLAASPAKPAGSILATETVSTFAEVARAMDDMRSGSVDVLLVLDGDPLHDLPASSGFAEATANVGLIVDFSSFPTDTGEALAHLRLPAPTYLETWGYHLPQPGPGLAIVGAQQPVVRQLHDTRSPVDVLLAAAKGVGGRVAEVLPWENEVACLKDAVDGLRERTEASITTGDPEAFWARWQQYGGWWATQADTEMPAPRAVRPGLATAVPADAGVEQAGNGSTFLLRPFVSLTLGDGRHANQPWLHETPDPMTSVMWDTWVEIAPSSAERLGVSTGDIVRVTSSVGSVEAPIYVYRGIGPDVVAMPLGGGYRAYGRYAAGRGANVGDLIESVSGAEGELAWGVTRVTIEPTGVSKALATLEGSESTVVPEGL